MEKLKKRSPVDRISDLPDSVLCYILSLLPTLVVVSTSILSRRWRFLWTKVPSLDFEYKRYRKKWDFVKFVDNVLLHHDVGRLEKFRLQWLQEFEAVYFDKWVSYAFARDVRVLSIELGSDFFERLIHIPLPGTLFTFGTLEFLKLSGFRTGKIPCLVCLPKLEVLILDSVDFESEGCVHNLISGSPLLHSLTILKSFYYNVEVHKISSPSLRTLEVFYNIYEGKLEIDAPALESLFLDGDISVKFLVKMPEALKEFKLDIDSVYDYDYEDDYDLIQAQYVERCNSIVELIHSLDFVNSLSLSETIMKAINYATTKLSAGFNSLTKLDVKCLCCHFSSLKVVLGCLTKLEVLNIRIDAMDGCDQDAHKKCWSDPEVVPIWLSCSLVQVSFGYFTGLQVQIAMIRYILMHGAVLKRFNLVHGLETNSYLLKKILRFPRSSPICQIGFTSSRLGY